MYFCYEHHHALCCFLSDKILISSSTFVSMNIIIPTDFSENSFKAIEYVFANFKSDRLKVTLLHSIGELGFRKAFGGLGVLYNLDKSKTQKNMDRLVQKITKKWGVAPSYHIREENIQDCINELFAKEHNLIVMSSKGENDAPLRLVGSVTKALLHVSEIPILLIPNNKINEVTKITIASDQCKEENHVFIRELYNSLIINDGKVNYLTVVNKDSCKVVNKSVNFEGRHITVERVENNSVVQGINNYLENNKTDILVLFRSKKSKLQFLLGNSVTKEMSSLAKIPLCIIPE